MNVNESGVFLRNTQVLLTESKSYLDAIYSQPSRKRIQRSYAPPRDVISEQLPGNALEYRLHSRLGR